MYIYKLYPKVQSSHKKLERKGPSSESICTKDYQVMMQKFQASYDGTDQDFTFYAVREEYPPPAPPQKKK